MVNPVQFLQEARQEAEKVSWPSRRETMVSTLMTLVMVVIACLFFLAVDAVLSMLVEQTIFRL